MTRPDHTSRSIPLPPPGEPRITLDHAAYRAALIADLDRVSARDGWARTLYLIGWIHLAGFGLCEAMQLDGRSANGLYVVVWGVEFGLVMLALRLTLGRKWYGSTPLAPTIVRVWGTFLILSFNVASLNNISGWDHDWFKPVLATLSSFGWMIMAYLVSLRFFWLAVVMYFTGLLMALFPMYNYGIYAVSWWATLQGLGLWMSRRARTSQPAVDWPPADAPTVALPRPRARG